MQGVEEACRSAQAQLEECKRERDRCLADSAAQLRAASEAQAAAQKALAATEADFRIALQVMVPDKLNWIPWHCGTLM